MTRPRFQSVRRTIVRAPSPRAVPRFGAIAVLLGALLAGACQRQPPPSSSRSRRHGPLVGIVPSFRPAPTLERLPDLGEPAAFRPIDRTITVEISQYAGYAGLIVANGGLEASENSIFFRNHNVRVKLEVQEEERLGDLVTGKLGASVTTADVVAVYGTRLDNAVIPVLVGFSRGADGVVTRRGINTLQGLKGKVVATSQFSEAEFLLRYLAYRSDIPVRLLPAPDISPDPNAINLTFTEDAFGACDLLLSELILNLPRVAGCVAWEPKTSNVVARSGGAAHFLTTNRNLLIVADVLLVNRGLAENDPEMVAALVDGVLTGNEMVRESPETTLSVIGGAFRWTRDKTRTELAKVQLASMADNIEFFGGAPNEIGTFAQIYESAINAYGSIVDSRRQATAALWMQQLRELQTSGKFVGRPATAVRLRALVPETAPLEALPAPEVLPAGHTLPEDVP